MHAPLGQFGYFTLLNGFNDSGYLFIITFNYHRNRPFGTGEPASADGRSRRSAAKYFHGFQLRDNDTLAWP